MSDSVAVIMTAVLVALGMYAGRLYERKSSNGPDKKEMDDAVRKAVDTMSSMSDAELINTIADNRRPGSKADGAGQ